MKCGIIFVCTLQIFFFAERNPQFQKEIDAGDVADVLAPNQHYAISELYQDLGRRHNTQNHPYNEREIQSRENRKAEELLHKIVQDTKSKYEVENNKLLPVMASPEFVMAVAKQSKIYNDANPKNRDEEADPKESLRTGEYWNDVWREDVKPILRSQNVNRPLGSAGALPKLGSVNAKIMPGSKLYQLLSALKKTSPRFLYVMNVNKS